MAERLPALRPREVVRALERAGFIIEHQSGSHLTLRNPDTRQKVTVAIHNRDLKRGTLDGIIKQTGLTLEEFLRLL